MKAQTKKKLQSRSNRLQSHSTISAAVHCINPVPIHYHNKNGQSETNSPQNNWG
jgi:hypothetical protein